MLHTALHDWHAAHGGRMVDFAGWHMPVQYSSITAEHEAVRQRVGLFDIAHMGRLRFTGPDACPFLDRLLTNDLTKLQPGQIRYSLVCNEHGGILDDVLVYRFADHYALVVNASNRTKIVNWCDRHCGGFDVQRQDETLETFMLALQGPRALDVLTECTPAPLSTLKYYTLVDSEVCGEVATISRTGYTGEDGFEVIVSRAAGPTLWDSLLRAGAREELAVCGLGCRDTLRLEAAMPLYGHELDEATDPFTAGLDFGVKLNAGDFIGREALRERLQAPRTFVRVGLELEGRRIAREGCPVQHAGQPVGRVTSGTFSPTLQKSIAMAYVPPSLAGPGTPVDVEIRGQSVAASVVRLPFYQRASG